MIFLPSKQLPKFCKPLEVTVIAARSAGNEVKNILCYKITHLPVTLEEIKKKTCDDNFSNEIKQKIKYKKEIKADFFF